MKISYCVSTKNRGHQLNNSLFALSNQKMDKTDYEVIVVDDNSEENIEEICLRYKDLINLYYLKLQHDNGWRDCSIGLNFALRRAKGEIWVISHPEIIISEYGLDILYYTHFGKYKYRQLCMGQHDKLWVTLPPVWMEENDKFNQEEWLSLGHKSYLLKHYDKNILSPCLNMGEGWSNFVTASMKREIWQRLGGLYEFESWGSIDPNIRYRRINIDVTDVVIDNNYDAVSLHQYHESSEKRNLGNSQIESRPQSEIILMNLHEQTEKQRRKEIKKEWSYS